MTLGGARRAVPPISITQGYTEVMSSNDGWLHPRFITMWTNRNMQRKEDGHTTIEYNEQEVRDDFQDFLDCMDNLESKISGMADEQSEEIEECLDRVYEVGERVYGKLMSEHPVIPETPFDLDEAIEHEHEVTGIDSERYEDVFYSIFDSEEMTVRQAWRQTLQEMEEERQRARIFSGQTDPSDWTVK